MIRKAFGLAALSALALTISISPALAACSPGVPNLVDNYEFVLASDVNGLFPVSGIVTIYNPSGAAANVSIWDNNFNSIASGTCPDNEFWSGLTNSCSETVAIQPSQVMTHFFTVPVGTNVKMLWIRVSGTTTGRGVATVSVDLKRANNVGASQETYDHFEIERTACK